MIFYLLILLLTAHGLHGQSHNLIHVHAIFRHGDRAPLELLSKDLNKIIFWPNGLGQLTDIGIKQQFQLGQWLRKRYQGLLNKTYNYQEVYVRSTDVDRTLMSAEANLAGLYYDNNHTIIQDLRWRPVPIHTIPKISDIVMLPNDCERYNIKMEEMYKSSHFRSSFQNYQFVLDQLRSLLENPDLEFVDVWKIVDILSCEKVHNVPWDNWVTNELYDNLTSLNQLNWQVMYHGEELAKLSGGLFLNEVITQLKIIATNPIDEQREKLRLYSGHDTDVAALMSAIGIYNNIQPTYASCLIIELWKTPKNDFYVKMHFKNDLYHHSTHLPELTLKPCKNTSCTLSEFINIVQPRTITLAEYKTDCFSDAYKSVILEIVFILVFVSLIFIIVCIIYLKNNIHFSK